MTDRTNENGILTRDSVRLGQTAGSMEEAIDFVGGLLIDRGLVKPGYIAGMKQREEAVSTYLGNGVALPHGTHATKDEILGTGIVVAQYPDGVDWGAGTAHLVIGLAAAGDDHVQVLSRLADVLQDEERSESLWRTDDLDLVFQTLTVEPDAEEVSVDVTILNPAGLHARPAALLVERAKAMSADISISKDSKTANAKSIMSVLALGAETGETVTLTASGPDADEAIEALQEIITSTEEE